ncbi:MAG: sigma-70 family RNA polymerase sigma factor, partial [Terracidiphilus sp.]
MDTAAPKPGELILTECAGEKSAADSEPALEALSEFPVETLKNLWQIAEAGACGFSLGEFTSVLANVGRKHNFGLPAGTGATNRSIETFFRALHLSDLALAHACAVGRDAAWELFVRRYRAFLSQTAVAITGSPSLGQELADSLYGELYGLRELDGVRRSPFASYSGRGSLEGWLRATLVQRFRDHHRRTYRENPLDEIDCPAQESPSPGPVEPGLLAQAVARTLRDLPAESRFLLSAYFLDRQTLLQ